MFLLYPSVDAIPGNAVLHQLLLRLDTHYQRATHGNCAQSAHVHRHHRYRRSHDWNHSPFEEE